MEPMPAIPVYVTAPATVASQNVARPTNSNGVPVGEGVLDSLVIAPVSGEPLFLSIWAGTGVTYAAATRFGGNGSIPIKDTANIVPLGYPLPQGCTIRISTAADGSGDIALLKQCCFNWV